MNWTLLDRQHMGRALELAARGLFTTSPNPRVGCVLAHGETVVGEGWHVRAGEAHAEVAALAQAGDRARGATAYVTLEPCSHRGRTGPCADALLQAGVTEVVVAMTDPNPLVSGQGIARLKAAGLLVREGLCAEEASRLNPGFIKRMTQGLPWVRAKTALSIDGRIALASGRSQWITDEACRADGHAWRARACVVATGIGTFLRDQPLLTVRAIETSRQPYRLLLDPRLEASPSAPFFSEPGAWVATSSDLHDAQVAQKVAALRDTGAEVFSLPSVTGESGGRLDLLALARLLADRGCNELHLESGGRLAGAFGLAGLIDEWLIYQAPVFLGEGPGPLEPASENPLEQPSQARRWTCLEATPVGDGLRIRLVRSGSPSTLPGCSQESFRPSGRSPESGHSQSG